MKRERGAIVKLLWVLILIELGILAYLWYGPVPFNPEAIDLIVMSLIASVGLLAYIKVPRRKPPIIGLQAVTARKRRR